MQNTIAYQYAEWVKSELAEEVTRYGGTVEGEVAGYVAALFGLSDYPDPREYRNDPRMRAVVDTVCGIEYADKVMEWQRASREVHSFNARRKPANHKPIPAAPSLPTY